MAGPITQTAAGFRQADVLKGIGLMTAAMLIVPSMDALAKHLGQTLPALEVALARFVGQLVFALAIAVVTGTLREIVPPKLPWHILRGMFLALATLLFFSALKVMPLSDAIAVFFVEPMILTALSALILKDQVGPRRWAACGVGFVGALIIVRPSWSVFGVYSLMPLGTACLFAGYLLLTRRLTGQGSILATQFVTGATGSVVLALVLVATSVLQVEGGIAVMPSSREWMLLPLLGLISLVTHGLVLRAFAIAPTPVLAPLNYLEIVSATALGYIFFRDFPDPPVWFGIALIVGSGLYIVHREHVRGRPAEAEPLG